MCVCVCVCKRYQTMIKFLYIHFRVLFAILRFFFYFIIITESLHIRIKTILKRILHKFSRSIHDNRILCTFTYVYLLVGLHLNVYESPQNLLSARNVEQWNNLVCGKYLMLLMKKNAEEERFY